MSIHINNAIDTIYLDSNNTMSHGAVKRIIEACVAAETAEARVTIAELKLVNEILRGENQRLTTAAAQVAKATP